MEENKISAAVELAVQENLNDMQVGVLRREMDRLQSIEVEFVTLREKHKALEESHKSLAEEYESRKVDIDSILSRESDLAAAQVEMADQKTQLHIDNQLIQLRHENAEQRVADHQNMVSLVFRGPVFQKSVIENRTYDKVVSVPVSDGGMVGTVQREYGLNDNTTTATTETQD